MTYIAYYRVSTDRQGQSGLGLEAQRSAVQAHGGEIIAEFVEVESGKKSNRPQLLAALKACEQHKATLIVAKLDRLARDAKLILQLVDSGVRVKFLDLPDIDTSGPIGRLMLTIMAGVAEFERRIISQRTKAALAAKSARGHKLGSPNPSAGGRVVSERAHLATLRAAEICRQMSGASLRDIAKRLEDEQIPSPSGGQVWHISTVSKVRRRSNVFN
mgnify:CR=1 FL=1|jgi:DNA invertase Pin-like site-specific DNA recombinase|nr:resolvase, N terminal domain protein [uncultured bacterium]AMP48345.1 resolvase, N terminal domain protein [uncultured bacterium]